MNESGSYRQNPWRYRAKIYQAISTNDPELLESGCRLESNGTLLANLIPGEISKFIESSIDSGNASMLYRMMQFRMFREALQDSHINLAITNGNPDILHCLLEAPFEDDEEPWFKKQNQPDIRPTVLLTCTSRNSCMVVEKSEVSIAFLLQCKPLPKVAKICCDKLMDRFPEISEDDKLIFYLITLYYAGKYTSLVYQAYVNKTNPNLRKQQTYTQLESLHMIVKSHDLEAFERHFELPNDVLTHPKSHCLTAIHLCLHYGFIDALQFIPGKLEIYRYGFHEVDEFNPLLELALKQKQYRWVADYLEYNCTQLEGSLVNRIGTHYDDLVYNGDLRGLLEDVPLWPFSPKSFALSHHCFRKTVHNLALKAKAGDWRYVLVFMEMNPNMILIAHSAWRLILDPLASEKFLGFVQHVDNGNRK